jgi:hypothetical protein
VVSSKALALRQIIVGEVAEVPEVAEVAELRELGEVNVRHQNPATNKKSRVI